MNLHWGTVSEEATLSESRRDTGNERPIVTEREIVEGLRALGFDGSRPVIVHASLRSFGWVEGGAATVCRALLSACGTVVAPAFTDDVCRVPAPPGLLRPHNAVLVADGWEQFDAALARAEPFTRSTPINRELGRIPETLRREFPHARSSHPSTSFIAAGPRAEQVVGAVRLDHPLGPIEAVEQLDGDVLLLGVGHDKDTAIHLAEQRLGRSRFYRYAKWSEGVWMELPNIPGESDGFDAIEPLLVADTREGDIGTCRARAVRVRRVLAAAEEMILADSAALLCNDADCERCRAAHRQRLAWLARGGT